MGGAMDLVCSGSKVVILMEHVTKKGESRLLDVCTYPLTGNNVVDTVITDMAVFEFDKQGTMTLKEVA